MIEDFISNIFARVPFLVVAGEKGLQMPQQQQHDTARCDASIFWRFDVEQSSTLCKKAMVAEKQQPMAVQGLIPPLSSHGYGCQY